ncbi:MAG: glycosyl hydrolase family 18 protein [Chlamydiales bacterium]
MIESVNNNPEIASVTLFPSTHLNGSHNQMAAAAPPERPQASSSAPQQSTYFDVGDVGAYINDFIKNGVFDTQGFEAYLKKIFASMQQTGQSQVDISFAQLNTLDQYLTGHFGPFAQGQWQDSIAYNMYMLQQQGVTFPDGGNLLNYICDTAHGMQPPMKISLSVGGAGAQDAQFVPDLSAQNVAEIMSKYGIDSFDVDYESNTQISQTMVSFYQNLHTALEGTGRTMSLTVMANPSETGLDPNGGSPNPNATLYNVFFDQQGRHIFTQAFDQLNVMAYANGGAGQPYYINPKQFEDWIGAVGGNPQVISLGLEDDVDYTDPNNNFYQNFPGAPPFNYNIEPGSTQGEAAAQIYLQLTEQLQKDGFLKPGEGLNVFWWPEENQAGFSDRYDPNGGGFYTSTNQEADFYKYLNGF